MRNPISPDLLRNERFPRSNNYDPAWIMDNAMGPHPLWLTEYLIKAFDLKPGMRVLDLGCGKGMTSVFLAREFGVQVYSVDFDEWEGWTTPEMRWKNAEAYGVENFIVPIKADACKLPFVQGFFDAIVCVNTYMYFGMEDAYLEYILRFLRPGGQLGVILSGYMKDITDGVPDYLRRFLGDELWTWQTLPWYRNLWEKTGLVSIDAADTLPDGCGLWLQWEEALLDSGKSTFGDETEFFKTDNGEYMGFIRLVATKKQNWRRGAAVYGTGPLQHYMPERFYFFRLNMEPSLYDVLYPAPLLRHRNRAMKQISEYERTEHIQSVISCTPTINPSASLFDDQRH